MKRKILNVATVAILSIAIFSCRKNDTIINQENLFDNLMSTQKSPTQVFELDAATGGTIKGAKGSKITFPPNCFVDAGNVPFTGRVLIALKESLKKSEWMMDGVSATAKTDILLSGGMLNVKVTRKDNGKSLKPAPSMVTPNANLNAVIKAEVPLNPQAPGVNMNLFVPDSMAQGGPLPTNDLVSVLSWESAPYYPMGNGVNSYIFQLPNFGWSNCDRLFGQPGPKTTIRVTPNMTGFAGATNMQAMLVYHNISTVITLPPNNGHFESYLNSIPVNSVADVVLIGKSIRGTILFKVLPATTFTALMNIPITPQEVSGATVTAYLNSVNQ